MDIVRNNPKTKTVHFGDINGQGIRQRYMEMTYDAIDKEGNVKSPPLLADSNIRPHQYPYSRIPAACSSRRSLRKMPWH